MKKETCIVVLLLLSGFAMTENTQARPSFLQGDTLLVEVRGTGTDARFIPVVVKVKPGDVIRFVVLEGLHTVTAYHPDNRRPLRIPRNVPSFDSGPLRTGDEWFLSIRREGVYDYFCLPHERMGHAGRIISGDIPVVPDYPDERIPQAVLETLISNTDQFFYQQNKKS